MVYRIFFAGAAGVIGRRLAPMLVEAGHRVIGSTRNEAGVVALRKLGVEPVVTHSASQTELLSGD